MLIGITIGTILIAWKWGDWKNWQKYHSTMIYIAMGSLLYGFLYHGHWLWQYKPEFLVTPVIAYMLSTFMILPLTGLLFLTDYPDTVKGQLFRITKFITIYIVFELVFTILGLFAYNYGWNIWWSLAWNCMMFPMFALHHKKPLIAYGASTIMVIIMLILFPVSFK
jgi:hypothetical protein